MGFRPRTVIAAFLLILALVLSSTQASLTRIQMHSTRLFLRNFPKEFPSQLSSWTGDNYCSWSGVTCDANGYVTLDLSNRGLVGEMPEVDNDAIDGSQVMVVKIDLSHNAGLFGSFEQDWKYLTQLQYLDLSYTSLDDELPSDWSKMTSLKTLKISNTRACKSLPQWTMPALQYADLSNNRLTGALKNEWSQMTNLQTVKLGGNNFCGCVPTSWNGNSVLTNAISSYGAVTDPTACHTTNVCTQSRTGCDKTNNPIAPTTTTTTTTVSPNPVTEDSTLQFLQSFAANYPKALSSWTGTDYCNGWKYVTCRGGDKVELNMEDAQLDAAGTLPDVVSDSVLLTRIFIWNCFTGPTTLPASWYRMSRLEFLAVASYNTIGTLPTQWGAMAALKEIYIAGTSVTGTLPAEWSAMPKVQRLDFSHSLRITGSLPAEWRALPSIRMIAVYNVPITGTLPDAWSAMSTLRTLQLAYTTVSGTLPASWGDSGSLPSLKSVTFMDNDKICGCEPDSWKTRPVLHKAVANTALASATCSTQNAC